jgi:predicted O-methyltransferase YrrM
MREFAERLKVNRLIHNIVKLPRRTYETIRWRVDPVHRLQMKANRSIRARFASERIEQLEQIPGNTSARECRLLAYLGMQSPEGGCYVEIGALFGKSTAWLVEAAACCSVPRAVVSIDSHLGGTWEGFSQSVEGFSLTDRGLEIRRGLSHDIAQGWTEPISFLWIDGSHHYEDVVNDIDDYVPHVIPGGWIVFDDAASELFPGVVQAIGERMHGRAGIELVGTIKNFALFRRAA